MSDYGDRQRIEPTVTGRAELIRVVEAVGVLHVVDLGTLGEYAEVVVRQGEAEAGRQLPEVSAHLADGCASCADDLAELSAMLSTDDPPPMGGAAGPMVSTPVPESVPALERQDTGVRRVNDPLDSGIHAADLPDPRVAEGDLARRARLAHTRRIWLVVALAVLIAVVGLSLVAMAFFAVRAPGTAGQGRMLPTNGSCPASHPIKGNRPSMIYHAPGGELYGATRPEECFASPADAEAAGYRASQR